MNDSLRQLLQYMNSLGQPDPQVAQQVQQAQAQSVPANTVPANAPGASVQNLREVPPGQDDTPAHSEEWDRGMPGGGAQSSAVQPAELALGLPMAADSMLAKMAGRAAAREGAERGASMAQLTPESHAAALKALREFTLGAEGAEANFGSQAARVAKTSARVAADQGEKALARAEPTGVGRAVAGAQRYSPELTEQLLKHLAEGLAK